MFYSLLINNKKSRKNVNKYKKVYKLKMPSNNIYKYYKKDNTQFLKNNTFKNTNFFKCIVKYKTHTYKTEYFCLITI